MTAPAPRSAAPPDELVARFRDALGRLWPEGGRLGLAVSGGPDSLAMLLLAEAAMPGRFEVATVDHGLRLEATEECAMVAAVCKARGIPCAVLRAKVSEGNLQAEARIARYAVLADWAIGHGLQAIATAHHADDQAETLLMRLNRGSGLSGLAGVRSRSSISGTNLVLLRPLLQFRRKELADAVAGSGLTPVSDPSNEDRRFDRVRMRKAIADAEWLNPLALARSAELLAQAEEALDWAALRVRGRAVERGDREVRCYADRAGFTGTPRSIVIGVLRSIFEEFGAAPRDSELARVLDALVAGERMNLGGVQATPGTAGDERVWHFAPENPRRAG